MKLPPALARVATHLAARRDNAVVALGWSAVALTVAWGASCGWRVTHVRPTVGPLGASCDIADAAPVRDAGVDSVYRVRILGDGGGP